MAKSHPLKIPRNRSSGQSAVAITIAHGAASLQGQLPLKEGETAPEKSFVYLVPAERERADDVLRFFGAASSSEGKVTLSNIAPGRYWVLVQPAIEGAASPLTTLRSPDEKETRAKLRREAEATKTEIELKPCQNVVDFQLNRVVP